MSPSTARQTFRETVAGVAARAKERLPEAVNGRIESAARLVILGDVEPLEDGTVRVGGSDPTRWYHLVGPTCTCTDFTQGKAPDGWCQHRIAAGIAKRVGELLPPVPPVVTETSQESGHPAALASRHQALPEAPASVNCHIMLAGRQVQLTLRDTDEARLLQRLQAVLAQYPVPQAPVQASRQGAGKDFCQRHQVTIQENHKDGRTWYSHRTDQGWCTGRTHRGGS